MNPTSADRPDTERPDADRPDTERPDTDPPHADRPDAGRPDSRGTVPEQPAGAEPTPPDTRAPSPVESEIGAPAGPVSFVRRQELEGIHQEMERSAGNPDRTLEGVQTYRQTLFDQYFRQRSPFIATWPEDLYIPGAADHTTYWTSAPPEDHRYRYRWTNTRNGQPDGSSASERTGQLFSWVNASSLDSAYIAFAGTGVSLVPRASLSSVAVSANIELVAESRWWFQPTGPIGFASFAYRGTAYVAGWEIDPITGAWELLSPFGARTLFSFDESGRGGSPISSQRYAFSDLSTTLELRGSRTYAIGVALEAQIAFECRDRSGSPYTRKERDDVRLWAAIAGIVPSITITI